jgi:hypothetical protein
VIDMDRDGLQETFLTYWSANHQYLSAWRLSGAVLAGFPKEIHSSTNLNAHASQHVLDLVTAGSTMSAGLLWVLPVDGSSFDPATSAAAWPKPRRDMLNTGCYPLRDPAGLASDGAPSPRALRLAPSVVRRGDLVTLRLPGGAPGVVEAWDIAGRRIGASPLPGTLDRAVVPAAALIGRSAGSGVFLMRWTPDSGAPARAARLLVLGAVIRH